MASATDTTKADQAKRARVDDQVKGAQLAEAPAPDDESDAARRARIDRDRKRAMRQFDVAAEAVARQNAGDCPVVVDDDDGPGSGEFCGGKLGHEGDHGA